MTEKALRSQIRKILEESVSNFLEKEKETDTRQLKDNSQPTVVGDPLSDVKMNQRANELGSDGENAPTVSVKAGATKGGTDFTTGQRTADFSDKTKQV